MQDAVRRAEAGFAEQYGQERAKGLRFVLSPYRVCPLGAHVDHQDGLVTGMAIDHGVVVAFAPRDDTMVRAASANFPGGVVFDLGAVPPAVSGEWGNFLRGAATALAEAHNLVRGADLFLVGQLPIGGLSSSAAVGVGCLLALEAVNDLDVAPEENIRFARAIENDYVGLQSGVLDQSMILLARQGRLLRFDCRTGEREYVALGADGQMGAAERLREWSDAESERHRPGAGGQASPADLAAGASPIIAVAYSGLSHALVGTGYNRRVAECREAAAHLLALGGIAPPAEGARLRDVPRDVYEAHRPRLPAELARRAAHFFDEQARVAEGTEAWRRGDVAHFGRLVAESGRSSIEQYECGAPELVVLYEALLDSPGVYGARFSGAGFRGSCLALVDPAAFEPAGERVRARYLDAYPQYASTFGFFRCASGPGARVTGITGA